MNQYASTVVANDGETYAYVKTASGYRWLTPRQITDGFSNKTLQFGNAYIKAYTVDDVRPTSGAPTWGSYAGGVVDSSATNVRDSQLIADGTNVYSLVATGNYSSKTYTLYQKGNDSWNKLGTLCEGASRADAHLIGGTLYGAYLTGDVYDSTLNLAKWDAAAGAWQVVASKKTDSASVTYDDVSLGEVDGTPLMVLTKYQDSTYSIEVLKLDGTSLAAVGSDFVPAGFSNDSSSGSSSFRTVVALPSAETPALLVRFYTDDSKTDAGAYANVLCRYEGGTWTTTVLTGDLSVSSYVTAADGTTYLLVMQDNGAPHLLVLKDGACEREIVTTGLPQIRVRSMALAIGAGRLYCVAYEGDSAYDPASLTPRAYVADLSDPGAFKSLGLDDEAIAGTWDVYGSTLRCTAQAALEGNSLVTLYGNRARSLEAFPKVITAAANTDPTSLTNVPARRTDGTSKTAQASGESNLVLLVRFAGDTTGDWDEAKQAYTGLNAPYLGNSRPEIRSEWERLVRLYDCVGDDYVKGTVREYLYQVSGGLHDLLSYFPQTTADGRVAYLTLDNSASYYVQQGDYTLVRDVLAKFASLYPTYNAAGLDTNGDGYLDNLTLLLTTARKTWVSHKFDLGGMGLTLAGKSVFNVNAIDLSDASSNLDGVAEHEYLHTLGLHDLYVQTGDAKPVGIWDILSTTAGEPWPLAQTRADLGWAQVPVINGQVAGAGGTYTLKAGTSSQAPEAYIIKSPLRADEYFIVECRKQGGRYSGTDLDRRAGGTSTRSAAGVIVYRVNLDHESNALGMGTCRIYVFRPGDTNATFAGGDGLATDAEKIVSNAQLTHGTSWASVGSTDRAAGFSGGALVYSDGTNSGIKVTALSEDATSATIRIEFADYSDVAPVLIDLAGAQVSVAGATYTGSALYPAVTVTLGGRTLAAGTDYTVSYANNVNAGQATVTIAGTGTYTGTATGHFTISRASLAGASTWAPDQTYRGSALYPTVTVTLRGRTLVAGRDYQVTSWASNAAPGTGIFTVTGMNNYTGTRQGSFRIVEGRPDLSGAQVSVPRKLTYTGSALYPAVTVTLNGRTLAAGTDYTVSYANNVNAGDATVTITGRGAYRGSTSIRFAIETNWKRLYGQTALDTMDAIAREGWGTQHVDTVVIASNAGYWDALAASGLAGACGSPVLLTAPGSLSAQTRAAVLRLSARRAYIVGGKVAVSETVARQVRDLGLSVTRLGGDTAVETSQFIAREVKKRGGSRSDVAVVTINGYYDALSIAPWAYANKVPVYITRGDNTLTASELSDIRGSSRAVVVGGTAAVSAKVTTSKGQLRSVGVRNIVRLSGKNAWETSQKVADWEVSQGMRADRMAVADGNGYWDGLTGGALCGMNGSILVLVPHQGQTADGLWFAYNPHCINTVIAHRARQISRGYLLGGKVALPAKTEQDIRRKTAR